MHVIRTTLYYELASSKLCLPLSHAPGTGTILAHCLNTVCYQPIIPMMSETIAESQARFRARNDRASAWELRYEETDSGFLMRHEGREVGFSGRELQVLTLMLENPDSFRAHARVLGVTLSTVKTHRRIVTRKLSRLLSRSVLPTEIPYVLGEAGLFKITPLGEDKEVITSLVRHDRAANDTK